MVKSEVALLLRLSLFALNRFGLTSSKLTTCWTGLHYLSYTPSQIPWPVAECGTASIRFTTGVGLG